MDIFSAIKSRDVRASSDRGLCRGGAFTRVNVLTSVHMYKYMSSVHSAER